MRRTSRADRSRAKCASSRKGAPRWIRIVSKHPSPYRNPRFPIETRAASSGIKTPSSHAEAVRGHLHAVLREGLRMSAELVERLPILRLRVRVRHDAAADREVGRLADDGRGADRDVPINGAIPGDVTDRPRVHAAAVRLEPLDDFHGSRFRRSRDRAAGERGPHEVRDRHFFAKASAHDALQMMYVRECAEALQERHMDAAELTHLAEVVPFQVDNHHVLRGVFLAREEFPRETLVLCGRSTSGPSPLDRTGLDVPAADAEEPFRTRRKQAVVSRLEESAERRGRARPEALVRRRGRSPQRKRDAMGEVDLVDLPVIDRPLRFLDRLDVFLRLEGFDRVRFGRDRQPVWDWRGLVCDAGARGDHERLAPHSVEDVHTRVDGEMHVRELKVGRFLIRQSFHLAAEVVREVAYGPSEERVRGRARGGPRQGVEELAERFDWISVGRGLAPRCRVCRVRTAAPEPSDGIGSEERVPGQLRIRQGGIEEERPMPTLQATEESDWVPQADRTYGEPHGLRHRWGIGRAHLRFWVAGPTQGEARADRSGEQLDPDPVRILDVDFRALRLLRRHRGLRTLSDQFAVRFLGVIHYERQMVDLLAPPIGRVEPGSRRIPIQFEPLAGTSSLELNVLSAVRHRPSVHDPHPERLLVEGERACQVPHSNARVVETVLHGNRDPSPAYVVATVIRRPVLAPPLRAANSRTGCLLEHQAVPLGASIAAQTASKSQSPAGFAAFAFRWSRWPALARSCTIHAVYAGDPVAPGEL